MDLPTQPTPALDALVFVLGLCVGSFLNVVAHRSLAEESIFWPPSKCPRCNHALAPWDNIPLLSYLLLGGKCRYCKAPIHWQYPAVEFATATIFVLIVHTFLTWNSLPFFHNEWLQSIHPKEGLLPEMLWAYIAGALFLASSLIAVTVTDFREKLIPHEITYPTMVVGILFSACVRHDALGALAGIGASYILFDFIAFYGLKVYEWMHGGFDEEPGRERRLRRRLMPRSRRKLNSKLRWRLDLATIEHKKGNDEPFEVMGGGDAVLSAVMSAFLGWQLLVMALSVGFILGTIMGLGLLIKEMAKANLLHKLARQCTITTLGCATAFGVFGILLGRMLGSATDPINVQSAASFAVLGAIGGLLLGVVSVGTKVSKPYPFGPALAAGGIIAIFFLPNWLY